jgi:hypothetical protein
MQRMFQLNTMMALAFFGMAGVALSQPPIPGPIEEAPIPGDGPTLKIIKQPVANNLQQVTIEFKWTDNTGIAKVKIKMLKKMLMVSTKSRWATKQLTQTKRQQSP